MDDNEVVTYDDLMEAEHEALMGLDRQLANDSQSRIWEQIRLFGMVVDSDCPGQSLTGFWDDPEQELNGSWYFPSEVDAELSFIDIDHPPKEDVAWDAKGVTA